ncbi:acetyltransferase [Vibrio cholerae]|nr:acetyltransferase [Vibrio cholerae]PNM40304.1 acetyltransferase [Vibrio cholerae]TQO75452.1 acetyltransferase [Vibrio cholerae]TQP44554.1 acetyltransferase [Vibrio cholerae]TQP76777.1 acetyltransferase [Vibrio cholerae]
MVTVVVIEFGVMRCQPLRRALAILIRRNSDTQSKRNRYYRWRPI